MTARRVARALARRVRLRLVVAVGAPLLLLIGAVGIAMRSV